MSNLFGQNERDEHYASDKCDVIKLIIESQKKDLGGFSVRRLLPVARQQMVGPWIFFDHIGPAKFDPGQGIDVRPHPHIHLATVTYLFEGEILHRDSLGSVQSIRPGDINLMVAGKGITHSERERPEVRSSEHSIHGLQLWLALPEKDENIGPAFYHYPQDDIPKLDIDGVSVRIMMGTAFGKTSPVKTFAKTLCVEAHMQPGQTLQVPEADERAVYVASGMIHAKNTTLYPTTMAVFKAGKGVTIKAFEESRIVIIGGEVLGKRYIEWNFVSSRKEAIDQAKKDWVAGKFKKVIGDEGEFIPLP